MVKAIAQSAGTELVSQIFVNKLEAKLRMAGHFLNSTYVRASRPGVAPFLFFLTLSIISFQVGGFIANRNDGGNGRICPSKGV
jgi:hypothetical protein